MGGDWRCSCVLSQPLNACLQTCLQKPPPATLEASETRERADEANRLVDDLVHFNVIKCAVVVVVAVN